MKNLLLFSSHVFNYFAIFSTKIDGECIWGWYMIIRLAIEVEQHSLIRRRGRLFHSVGAAFQKASTPKCFFFSPWSTLETACSRYHGISSWRHWGAVLFKQLYARNRILCLEYCWHSGADPLLLQAVLLLQHAWRLGRVERFEACCQWVLLSVQIIRWVTLPYY